MNIFPNGLGPTTGDTLATTKPLYTSGSVWYVHYGTGTDSGSAGQDAENPLKTVAQAYTNASAGDIIVFLDGHEETVTAELTIAKQLFLVGGGASAGLPTVKFTMNAANKDIFDITAVGTEIRGITFTEPAIANVGGSYGAKVALAANGCRVIGCRFEMGALDTGEYGIFIPTGSNGCRITNTTVISTATSKSARPYGGISASGGAALQDLELEGLVLSDGTVGFQSPSFNMPTATLTRLRATGVSLLLGAEMSLGTVTGGYVATPTATRGGRILW